MTRFQATIYSRVFALLFSQQRITRLEIQCVREWGYINDRVSSTCYHISNELKETTGNSIHAKSPYNSWIRKE